MVSAIDARTIQIKLISDILHLQVCEKNMNFKISMKSKDYYRN